MNIRIPTQQTKESFVRRHRSFFVGLFVLIPLAIIAVLIPYKLMKSEWLQKRVSLYVKYDQNPGLAKGNSVNISGMPIGRVHKVELVKVGTIAVTFKIEERYLKYVKKDTKAMLNQKNFPVGDWEIQLTGGTEGAAPADTGDTLAAVYSLQIEKLAAQATGMLGDVDTIIDRLATGRGSMGRLLTEDSLLIQVQGILRNVNTITVQAMRMMKQADTLLVFMNKLGATGVTMADTVATIMTAVRKSLGDATVVMENVKVVSDDLGPMMKEVQDNLDAADMMMRGLQKNWVVKKMIGAPEDKMMKDAP